MYGELLKRGNMRKQKGSELMFGRITKEKCLLSKTGEFDEWVNNLRRLIQAPS